MIIEALFTIVSMLFWPVVILGVIVYFVRHQRRGQPGPELEQTLAEISGVLGEVRHRLRDVEGRVERIERQGIAPVAAPAPPAPPEAAAEAALPAQPIEVPAAVEPAGPVEARAARLRAIFGEEHESMVLHPSIRTISELFRDVGYQTVAVSNNPWVGPLTGLDRGFDYFYGVWMKKMFRFIPVGQKIRNKVKKIVMEYSKFLDYRDSGAERTVEKIKERNNKIYDEHRPYFMFINFMELHHPYKRPEPYRSKFFKSNIADVDLEQDYRKINGKCSEKIVDFDCLRMLCNGEQAYLDSKLRDLFRFLDDENTVWRSAGASRVAS